MFQKDDPIIRLYNREYCEELFPAKWREHSPITLPWMFVAGSFNKALEYFYGHGTLVAKLLGQDNIDAATRAFSLEDISVSLPLELRYLDNAIKASGGSETEWVKLLKPSEAQEQFKTACTALDFKWDSVKAALIPLLEKLYLEDLIMVQVTSANQAALALAFEDDESVDLRVRVKLSTPDAQQEKKPA